VSIPKRDSVSVLKKYADKHEIEVYLVIVDRRQKKQIYRLGRKDLLLLATDGGPDNFIHSENIVLIDRKKTNQGNRNVSNYLQYFIFLAAL
jgi:protein SCO1/2